MQSLLKVFSKIPRNSSCCQTLGNQVWKPITSILTNASSRSFGILPSTLGTVSQNIGNQNALLQATLPTINQSCGFKVRGLLKLRCKDCYFVIRKERKYVICKAFPRHKQMSMVEKPHNTWILTHATQSPRRPW